MGAILQYGLSVTLVGIGTVFVGLIILIALIKLMETQEIRPYEFSGRTFDCGSPAGFVNANLHMAMMRPDIAGDIEVSEYTGGYSTL